MKYIILSICILIGCGDVQNNTYNIPNSKGEFNYIKIKYALINTALITKIRKENCREGGFRVFAGLCAAPFLLKIGRLNSADWEFYWYDSEIEMDIDFDKISKILQKETKE